MIAFADRDPAAITDANVVGVRDAIAALVNTNAEFQKAFGTGTNGRGAITTRIRLAQQAVTDALA
jgi:hypothetical protein